MDCSLPGFSVHGILQARMLAWVAISSSRGSFRSRDRTLVFYVSCIGRQIPHHWAIWEAPLITLSSHFKLFCAPFSSLSMMVFNWNRGFQTCDGLSSTFFGRQKDLWADVIADLEAGASLLLGIQSAKLSGRGSMRCWASPNILNPLAGMIQFQWYLECQPASHSASSGYIALALGIR